MDDHKQKKRFPIQNVCSTEWDITSELPFDISETN